MREKREGESGGSGKEFQSMKIKIYKTLNQKIERIPPTTLKFACKKRG